MAAQVGEDGARLVEQRQRLAGQKIRLRRTEEREALRMEIRELCAARLVVAAVFRAVGKIRAIGADRRGDERLRPISPRRRLPPERIACPLHEANRARDEFFCLVARKALLFKALDGRLIARTRRNVCARLVVIAVDGLDELRFLEKRLGGPKRIVRVKAAACELRAKGAVEHEQRIVR